MDIGIAGEVRFVLRDVDGNIKKDTRFQKNLILNLGLDFFGGNAGSSMFQSCVIGAGNSAPTVTQTLLDSFVAITSGDEVSRKFDYVNDGSNLYKINKVYKYSFTGLNNVNVSEVGLSSQGTSSDYYLCTRALIKDVNGAPTTISVQVGETLDVYYKLWQVFSTLDGVGNMNLLDGKGGSIAYDYKIRPAGVGGALIGGGTASHADGIGEILITKSGNSAHKIHNTDLGAINSQPSGNAIWSTADNTALPMTTYVANSYKRVTTASLSVSQGNGNVRSFVLLSTMGLWQIQFGRVSDDAPIVKTDQETLSIPFEFSWGRYEGVL